MKYFIVTILTFFSLSLFAGVPPKITVVGKYKSMDNSIVLINSSGGLVKVPKSSVVTKKLITGEKVVARVPVKDFLKLN